MSEVQKPVFRDLTADDPDPEITEIESLCMYCHSNGKTRLLLTRIPYYKNVVIMSFTCEDCGYENNEIQSAGAFAEQGVRWTLKVTEEVDLNRQVVKSDYTSIRIPEVDLEIPSQSQKGEVTTVEGIISRVIAGLTQDQRERRTAHGEAATQIDEYIAKLALLKNDLQFTVIVEDISGNSFVENPEAPKKDSRCIREDFIRTKEQDHALGIFAKEELPDQPQQWGSALTSQVPNNSDACTLDALAGDEVLQFPTNCPECNAPCETNMKVTNIPHFKDVVIMATVCDACGHRTNEVKSGGGIEPKGVKMEIRVAGREDFSRDVLKSETCSMQIPALDLDVGGRALGGRFTTVEGVLAATIEQLRGAPGVAGDAPGVRTGEMKEFIAKLQEVLDGKRQITLVLDDPAGNSYVQSLVDEGLDEGLKITKYERSYEQNEELGLNDMKTENYEKS